MMLLTERLGVRVKNSLRVNQLRLVVAKGKAVGGGMEWSRHKLLQAIIMELSRQESRSSAGNTHGPEQAGITQLSRQ